MSGFRLLVLRFLMTLPAVVLVIAASASDRLVQHQFEGSLGENLIGMTVVRDGDRIQGGHYFYQKFLQDIPITGTAEGSTFVLTEPGGGTFHLHFVGNGSEGGRPLDFHNSVGMTGTWVNADGTRTYRVTLNGSTVREGGRDGRRYDDVTRAGDLAFETRVQALLAAVLSGDKTKAVRFISYPLVVNFPGRTKKIRNASEVLAAWNDLFTPAVMAALQSALPHDMFVRHSMAMIGNGEAWFDARGLAVLNIPPAAEILNR